MEDYTRTIESWGKIFKDFQQVENVRVDSSAERVDITIKGRKDILQATQNELDDNLYKFRCNPREVATDFLKKHNVLVYYKDTLVGYFDIMGYSSFIEKNPIEESIKKISKFFQDTGCFLKTDIYDVKLDHWILSDSIILVVDTNRCRLFAGSLEFFLGACSSIMSDSMQEGFPLRGAIGGGDFYKDGEVMVSSALIDAYNYEKKQEWLGAILTPKALELVENAKQFEKKMVGQTKIDFSSEKFNPFVRYGKIPWKEDGQKPSETYYIKPFQSADKDWVSKLPKYFCRDSEKIKNSHCLYATD